MGWGGVGGGGGGGERVKRLSFCCTSYNNGARDIYMYIYLYLCMCMYTITCQMAERIWMKIAR